MMEESTVPSFGRVIFVPTTDSDGPSERSVLVPSAWNIRALTVHVSHRSFPCAFVSNSRTFQSSKSFCHLSVTFPNFSVLQVFLSTMFLCCQTQVQSSVMVLQAHELKREDKRCEISLKRKVKGCEITWCLSLQLIL